MYSHIKIILKCSVEGGVHWLHCFLMFVVYFLNFSGSNIHKTHEWSLIWKKKLWVFEIIELQRSLIPISCIDYWFLIRLIELLWNPCYIWSSFWLKLMAEDLKDLWNASLCSIMSECVLRRLNWKMGYP